MQPPALGTIALELREGGVGLLELRRPDRLNALSHALLTDLRTACRWLDEQSDVRVVVVRGAGRAFSAGFDLDDYTGLSSGTSSGTGTGTGTSAGTSTGTSPRELADLGRIVCEALAGVPQLTIAAVHGHVVGGGVLLTASCDLRVAAESTRFAIPEVDLGIPLAWGGVPRLTRELGPALTKELVLTCRPFSAAEALSWRFVNRVVPDGDVFDAADVLATQLATKPAFSLGVTKTQVNGVLDEIAGMGRSSTDADMMVGALHDPESRATAARYLAERQRR